MYIITGKVMKSLTHIHTQRAQRIIYFEFTLKRDVLERQNSSAETTNLRRHSMFQNLNSLLLIFYSLSLR